MSTADKKDFLSDDTEKKVREFEEKLKAEQAALPDTSIRGGAGGINVLENYYFNEEGSIPIYDSGTNKQIDRVDMKVDKMRRSRRTAQLQDEVDEIMQRVYEERKAAEAGNASAKEEAKTAPFVYAVPIVLVIFGIIVIIAMNL
jgi:hypothetical protein